MTKFQTSEAKTAASSVNKIFLQFDLVTYFLTTLPLIEPDLNIIKNNILIKFHHAQVKNAVRRVLTRLPSIWPSDLVLTRHDPYSNLA